MHQLNEPIKPIARIEDGYIILNDGAMWDYEIRLDQIRSKDQVAQWIDHLSDKRWFSDLMKLQMLRLLDITSEAES